MKLAFCLFKYFPFGGLQRDMLLMASEAADRGHDIHIFCRSWQGDKPSNMTVHLLAVSGLTNTGKAKSYYEQLMTALDKQPFDLIVGFNKMPGLDLYFAADSCFAHKAFRQRSWLYRQSPRSKIYLEYENAVFGSDSNTEILEISKNERAYFIEFYNTDTSRFHSLPPGIARNRIQQNDSEDIRAKTRISLGLSKEQPVMLALGSGFRTKGLDRSINALASLASSGFPDIQLLVVGQDNPKSFRKQAKKLKLENHVHFLGGRDDVPDLLQVADLLIHPAYRENSGMALLEAVIAGLPVITTDTCGYACHITEANMGSVISSPYDPVKTVDAAKAILATPRKEWNKRGLVFSANDIYSMHSRAVDTMEKMVKNKNKQIP